MPRKRISILQVNTRDVGGGAERIVIDLQKAYQERGCLSYLVTGYKLNSDSIALSIPNDLSRNSWARTWLDLGNLLSPLMKQSKSARKLRNGLTWIGQPRRIVELLLGREDFAFPGTRKLLDLPPQKPDILHLHNLHGDYFDLRHLPRLSNQVPTFVTLHDEWMFTGHCAYTMTCPRWESGCGQCPDLKIYPAVARDVTDWNWQRKRHIFQNSRLYVATPSQWLMERVHRSILYPVETRVIHNGVDLHVFNPGDSAPIRKTLNIPFDTFLLLAVSSGEKQNPFKDYNTIEQALRLLRPGGVQVCFISLGGEAGEEQIGDVTVKRTGYITDPYQVASYYRAADIFLHATNADNFPTTILESLACGTPVIATAVGGIPEQITDSESGFLVPQADASAMASYIERLRDDDTLRTSMKERAALEASIKYDIRRQAKEYLTWYQEILDQSSLSSPPA